MHSVLTAPLAILVKLEAVGVVLLVLLGRVVAALALSAGADRSDHCRAAHPVRNRSEQDPALAYRVHPVHQPDD